MPNDKTGILAISLGTAPAVITETIWALTRRETAFPVDELHVVTTATGLGGLGPVIAGCVESGWRPGEKLIALCDALSIAVPKVCVWLPIGGDGVSDMKSLRDCAAFGDAVCAMLCELTGRVDSIVHLSIAGGRKTMSYHAGAAMTIYGRGQDAISQILVAPPELERCADFWWPQRALGATASYTPYGSGETVAVSAHIDDVELTLVETPFYRARQWIPQQYLAKAFSFDRMMQIANATQQDGKLVVDLTRPAVMVCGVEMEGLMPAQVALFGVFAHFAMSEKGSVHITDLGHEGRHRSAYMAFREATRNGQLHAREQTGDGVPRGSLSTMQKALRKQLDSPEAVEIFTPVTRDGLISIAALPEQIEIIGAPQVEGQFE